MADCASALDAAPAAAPDGAPAAAPDGFTFALEKANGAYTLACTVAGHTFTVKQPADIIERPITDYFDYKNLQTPSGAPVMCLKQLTDDRREPDATMLLTGARAAGVCAEFVGHCPSYTPGAPNTAVLALVWRVPHLYDVPRDAEVGWLIAQWDGTSGERCVADSIFLRGVLTGTHLYYEGPTRGTLAVVADLRLRADRPLTCRLAFAAPGREAVGEFKLEPLVRDLRDLSTDITDWSRLATMLVYERPFVTLGRFGIAVATWTVQDDDRRTIEVVAPMSGTRPAIIKTGVAVRLKYS